MKKILLSALSILFLSACTTIAQPKDLEILTLFSSKSNNPNKLWVGTFQLVFNDMKDEIIKKDVYFIDERPTSDLKGLNKKEFNASMLDESSYYKSVGLASFEAKAKIKNAIKEKFNETSDILDTIDWTPEPFKYYAYAMLKKEFEFLEEFDKLGKFSFNNSSEQFEFFGINDSSKSKLDENVQVLFYNNENDYAVKLLTKSNDNIYLYRTDKNETFKNLFDSMNKNASKYKGDKEFNNVDTLKVPNLKIKDERKYTELCNKTIKGTDFYFSDAIETIQLELDNKGGKIKSEAAIIMKCNMLPMADVKKPRHFNFDKTFVMFLTDKGKADPYFALRIQNLEKIGK